MLSVLQKTVCKNELQRSERSFWKQTVYFFFPSFTLRVSLKGVELNIQYKQNKHHKVTRGCWANTNKLKCKLLSHKRLLKFGELSSTHALTNRLTVRTHPCWGSLARKKRLLFTHPQTHSQKCIFIFFPLHIAVLLFLNFRGSCLLEPHSMPFYRHSFKCSPYFLRHFPSSAAFSWVHLSLAAAFHHPICCLASAYINHFSAWKSL